MAVFGFALAVVCIVVNIATYCTSKDRVVRTASVLATIASAIGLIAFVKAF